MSAAPDPRWLSLWASGGASEADAQTEWQGLLERYAEPHRRYHSLRHVLDCLGQLDQCRHQARDPTALEAALWYHDVVYDPRSSHNEQESAMLARAALNRAGFPDRTLADVEHLILCTRHDAAPSEPDAALMTDIDLSILGATETSFAEYEAGIRFEYAWVPPATYRARRTEVLLQFLHRPSIYATPLFRERLEAQARSNLLRTVAELRGAVQLSG